jgi:tetratricopeptide (TPR) repeat protein
LDPRNAEALTGMAHVYEVSGRVKEAEETYKKVIAMRPDYWDNYNSLALFYDRQRRFEEAVTQVRKAIAMTPDNAVLYFNLGAMYVDMNDPKKAQDAEQALRKSIELNPTYAAYANLGVLYMQQKRYAESAQVTEKALQLNDKNYLVWDNLRQDYEWLKNTEQASQARERELPILEPEAQARPQDAVLQSALGVLYAEKKLRDKALQRIQAALAMAPDDPQVAANAAEAYEDLGERAEAIQCALKAIQKGMTLSDLLTSAPLQDVVADPKFRALASSAKLNGGAG